MKKHLLLALAFAGALIANDIEKKGFLTTKWCADNGLFKDCRTESAVCGYEGCFKDWKVGDPIKTELVLFIHEERKYYNLDISGLEIEKLDEAFFRNDVSIQGQLSGDKIIAKGFKAPPPPGKSFFKGCL